MTPRFLIALAAAAHLAAAAAPIKLTVQAGAPGPRVSPDMWGIFFEDVNFGADGGLYAEMVKNRSFEFPDPMMGWIKLFGNTAKGGISIRTESPLNAGNPHYVRLQSEGAAPLGISNEGFRGMGLHSNEAYNFSARIRQVSGSPRVLAQLVAEDGTVLETSAFEGFSPNWQEYAVAFHPHAQEARARLNVLLDTKGAVDLDMISLFPQHTWKDRPRGLRADMAQMLADLKPGFMRFPGGCIVEGPRLDGRYQWKNTLGPIEERKWLVNRWNNEFLHRPTPDYFQSFGLGFFEYFQLCEDMGASPLPILNCGMACQFNSGELCPLDQLDPYIQDALDLVEFANGPVDSPWGSRRAALGHPEPFHLRMMGVGNEQWGPQYVDRYTRFAKALKAKYPELTLVAAAGPAPVGQNFDFLWSKWRELHAGLVDEHCYANPSWFFANTARYDHYDRGGPKVFMGEYAAQSVGVASPKNKNTLECALAEAAYMTGLERNADVVRMASYAPLFANAEAWQWSPALIWFNSLQCYGTPSYYAQKLFSRHRGSAVLPVAAEPASSSFFVSAVWDDVSGEIIIKAVNASKEPVEAAIDLQGAGAVSPAGQTIVLTGASLDDQNSFENPTKISPKTSALENVRSQFNHSFEPYSLTVMQLKATGK